MVFSLRWEKHSSIFGTLYRYYINNIADIKFADNTDISLAPRVTKAAVRETDRAGDTHARLIAPE